VRLALQNPCGDNRKTAVRAAQGVVVSNESGRPVRTVLTVVMDILVVVAIAETVRLIVLFFGALASQGWGEAIVALTDPITIPFGVEAIKTPYGGVFDVDTALTVVVLLLIEWVLSVVRSRS
jgi:uncharacterized protein YggT (Ycf19 family)